MNINMAASIMPEDQVRSSKQGQCPLLSMPPELRNWIWQELMLPKAWRSPINIHQLIDYYDTPASLLRTSSQVRCKTKAMWYASHNFIINHFQDEEYYNSARLWFSSVVREDAKHVRRVQMNGCVRRYPGADWLSRSARVVVDVDLRKAPEHWVTMAAVDKYREEALIVEALTDVNVGIAELLAWCRREDGAVVVDQLAWLSVLKVFRDGLVERNAAAAWRMDW